MNASASPLGKAWQPLTFGGVAAFSWSKPGRLLTVQVIVALIAVGCVIAFLELAWVPPIERSIASLPETGEIRTGLMNWTNSTPLRLGEASSLSFVIDPDDQRPPGQVGDVECVFLRDHLRVSSILGHLDVPYGATLNFPLHRAGLEARWGAWHFPLLALLAIFVFVGLFASWWLLAALYAIPIRVIGFYADRQLTVRGSFRLAGAALMPGALFLSAAIALYGLRRIDLVQLLAAQVIHFVIGWLYVAGAAWKLPVISASGVTVSGTSKNPFATSGADPSKHSGD